MGETGAVKRFGLLVVRLSKVRLSIIVLLVLLITRLLPCQLPPPQKLSAEDRRAFNEELTRLRTLLDKVNDKCTIQLQIAKTYAAGGQYREAVEWLRKVVDADLGFDPSRDPDFSRIQNTIQFQALMKEVRQQTPPVSHSRSIATIQEADLFPESLAFDPSTNTFFLGSTAKDEIVRCSAGAACVPLITPHRDGQGYVLGLKIDKHSNTLWATSNTDNEASLRQYDIQTGKLIRTARIAGKHVFNDIALSSTGVVYVADTAAGAVYKIDSQTTKLQQVAPDHTFTAANGIAISPDEETLYVSVWGDGIDAVDLKSGSVIPVQHPATVCLAYIDGLYATKNNLIAIQNGPMSPRIVQFRLSADGRNILGMTILERRNPLFNGLTTGALVKGQLYYIANTQIDQKNSPKLNPLRVLAVHVFP